ncbi:MAG: chemotaxis response regulator protein-glutamate methylesterase [Candidatus Sedimenticola sp. (ex Thyasira tokunagai)]
MSVRTRVLIVDDSAFFRRRIEEILKSDPAIEVVGQAADGLGAVEEVKRLRPDVVTMDVEMPRLDGIGAVKRIMKECPTAILMFSSLTYQGAKATLDALEAGAADFLPKQFDTDGSKGATTETLLRRIRAIGTGDAVKHLSAQITQVQTTPVVKPSPIAYLERGSYKLVAIGASTGGPVAIKQLLSALAVNFPLPILIVVHMPASFTAAFAERLNQQCRISVKEAAEGDILKPSHAYLAPGGMQMILERYGSRTIIRVKENTDGLVYKPSVDISLGSAARIYPDSILAIVLTGMGADGMLAAKLLKQGGSTIWSQSEESCVVFGMPRAVEKAGLSDRVLPLDEIAPMLSKAV